VHVSALPTSGKNSGRDKFLELLYDGRQSYYQMNINSRNRPYSREILWNEDVEIFPADK